MKYLLSITLLFSSFLPLQASFTVSITDTSTEVYTKVLENAYLSIQTLLRGAPRDVYIDKIKKVEKRVREIGQPAFIIIPSVLPEEMFGKDFPQLDTVHNYLSGGVDSHVSVLMEGNVEVMVISLSVRFLDRLSRDFEHSGPEFHELEWHLRTFMNRVREPGRPGTEFWSSGSAAPLSKDSTRFPVYLLSSNEQGVSQLYRDALRKMTSSADLVRRVKTTKTVHALNGDLLLEAINRDRRPTLIILSANFPTVVGDTRIDPADDDISLGLNKLPIKEGGVPVYVLALPPRYVSQKPRALSNLARQLDSFVTEANTWTRLHPQVPAIDRIGGTWEEGFIHETKIPEPKNFRKGAPELNTAIRQPASPAGSVSDESETESSSSF